MTSSQITRVHLRHDSTRVEGEAARPVSSS